MKAKFFTRIASLVLLIALALPASSAIVEPVVKTENARVEQIAQRLNEIKAMDRTEMTSTERKALRNEVKGLKKEMKSVNNGVYLSVGAIIIIILLLILIL
jgi:3'-phosphoadenosine 5'-phosphosulfate sulfotransferase